MDDITRQLRESCFCEGRGCELCRAADEIERLRAELAECKRALRLCVDVIEHISYAWQGQGTHPQTAINAALAGTKENNDV